jgi:hypothetical protein
MDKFSIKQGQYIGFGLKVARSSLEIAGLVGKTFIILKSPDY